MRRDTKVLVFVYGSLLKGLGNHSRLKCANAKFVGTGTVRAKLFTNNWFWPFIKFSNSNKDKVLGEIYEVTYGAVIDSLDRLEGYNIRHNSIHTADECQCLFFRKRATTNTGQKVTLYVAGHYLADAHATQITTGNWREAKNNADTESECE